MQEDFIAYLLADAPLAALVPATRIKWVRQAQPTTAPYVTLTVISKVHEMLYEGPDAIVSTRVQIDCFALTWKSAISVARALEARLSGARFTQGSTRFEGVFLDAQRESFETDVAPEDKLFRISVDYILKHKGA